jgi:hypothetical protein
MKTRSTGITWVWMTAWAQAPFGRASPPPSPLLFAAAPNPPLEAPPEPLPDAPPELLDESPEAPGSPEVSPNPVRFAFPPPHAKTALAQARELVTQRMRTRFMATTRSGLLH